MKLTIVDYGMGNIKSLVSTLTFIGVDEVIYSSSYEELSNADKLLLPGVGAFGEAIKQIQNKKIDLYLQELVIDKKKPLLGICLGMQLLSNSSKEDGEKKGLGFINGEVHKMENANIKIPHIGFNQVKIDNSLKLYQGFQKEADFYFAHSYKMMSEDNINQCKCNYGNDFIASYEYENIGGVQFHPELSQYNGLNVLKNFIQNF